MPLFSHRSRRQAAGVCCCQAATAFEPQLAPERRLPVSLLEPRTSLAEQLGVSLSISICPQFALRIRVSGVSEPGYRAFTLHAEGRREGEKKEAMVCR